MLPKCHQNILRFSCRNAAVVFLFKTAGNINEMISLWQEVILNFPAIPAYKVRVRPLRHIVHIGTEEISVIIVFVRASVDGSSFTGQNRLEETQGETAPVKIFSFHK